MKKTTFPVLIAAILFAPLVAIADPDKDESGHGKRKHGRSEYKEEYWDGNCKVERKMEKNGNYKEERKCENRARGSGRYHEPARAYGPPPVYLPAPPPGVVIQGTVRVNP